MHVESVKGLISKSFHQAHNRGLSVGESGETQSHILTWVSIALYLQLKHSHIHTTLLITLMANETVNPGLSPIHYVICTYMVSDEIVFLNHEYK
jgi:hypothetical protein